MTKYLDVVHFLEATRGFEVDGEPFRVWIGLLPPSELPSAHCAVPPDSPLTSVNETALFANANYSNYTVWGTLVGLLAKQFPHLVAIDIDDFSENIGTHFSGDNVAQITSNMRAHAPWLSLASVTYHPFTGRFPDVAFMLDAAVFFFRDMIQCAGAEADCPCAPKGCPWGPRHTGLRHGQCLAGSCAEPTVQNAADEIAQVAAGLPAGRQMIVGYYATGHSSGGQPTPRYVSRLLQTISAQPHVAGVMTYTLKSAEAPCPDPPLFESSAKAAAEPLQHQLGCIVSNHYASLAPGLR